MSIAKLLLFLVSVFFQQHSATAPNPRPPTEQLRYQRGLERSIPHSSILGRTISFAWGIFHLSLLLALSDYCPPTLARPIHHLLPTSITSNPATVTTLTPTFLLGSLFTLAGGLLRAYCFRVLGSSFTFELSIRPSHTLITDGAYGVIRHPSYTGALMLLVGWLFYLSDLYPLAVGPCAHRVQIWASSIGIAWNDRNCEALTTSAFACIASANFGLVYTVLRKRMDNEDAMLQKHFGEEWRAWAKRVPCRLIPGVY